MKALLFITLIGQGYDAPISVSTHEMPSMAACFVAGTDYVKHVNEAASPLRIKVKWADYWCTEIPEEKE